METESLVLPQAMQLVSGLTVLLVLSFSASAALGLISIGSHVTAPQARLLEILSLPV